MKTKWMFVIALLLLIVSGYLIFVSAGQPTQQYNKINLNPSYVSSIVKNTNQSFNISINPPDKISEVTSAMVIFQTFITSSPQIIHLKVNNVSCKNPTYTGTSSGFSQVVFDCSNVINKSGNYDFKLWSDKDIGSVVSWLDLVYMNNPAGDLELSGTEYSPNDPATFFVQLKDNQGLAIQNGACYINVWYPANSSNVHPYVIQNAPMLQALGNEGLYYYNMFAPEQLGVYMLSARCAYTFNWLWIYPPNENVYFAVRRNQSGTWAGNETVLNSNEDMDYERCDATAGVLCQANYTFNVNTYGNISNITTINLYFAGQGDIAGKTVTFAYWNGTTFVNLPNILTVVPSGASITQVGTTDQFVTNSIPASAIINGTVIIRYTGQTGLARYYHNWLSLALLTSSGTIQDVKGSSEMHITNIANASLNAILNNTQIAENIWNYSNRSITEFPFDVVNESQIAESVWNYSQRELTVGSGQVGGTEYSTTETGGRIIARLLDGGNKPVLGATCSIYIYKPDFPSNLSSYSEGVMLGGGNISGGGQGVYYYDFTLDGFVGVHTYVINCSKGGLNYYLLGTYHIFGNNLTAIGDAVWNASNKTLSSFNFTVNATINNSAVADAVWNYNGTISTNILNQFASFFWSWVGSISSNIKTLLAVEIWSSPTRTLTDFNNFNITVNASVVNQADLTNYTAIQNLITQYGNNDVTNYTLMQNLITDYGNLNSTNYTQIQNLINQYGNTDTANYTLIQYLVSQYGNNDVTNYSLMTDLITQYGNNDTVNYTLVGQLITQNGNNDNTNYTQIQQLINQYGNYDTTNYTLMIDLITNYGNLNSTNYTAIQNLITQYGNTDNANYTLIQYLVSQYGNNDNTNYSLMTDLITQYGNYDMVNYTLVGEVVANNVWNYNGTVNNNVLSQFGSFIWSWTGNISSVITDAFAISNWNSTTRTLTDFNNFNVTVNATINNTELVNQIWGANNQTDLTNYTLMQELITQYGNNQNQTDLTNYTAIQNLITQYGNSDSTNYTLIQYLISQYGNYDSTNYTLMEEIVAQYANNETINYTQIQNLITQFGNNDVSNYTLIQDLITQYGNNQTDMTNYSLMTDLMMQFANNDSTNYSAIQNLITQYGNTDNANYTLIQYLVSQYGNNDNTNYSLMTDLITQFGNNDMVNYTLVEDIVNQYSTNYTLMQNLITQFGNNQNQTDLTNYTLMQDLITQFGNNQNQTDLTNYTAIQNLITQYGNTDTANYTLMQYIVSQYGNNDNTNYTLMQDLINQYGNTDNVNYTLVQDLILQYGNNQNQTDLTDYNKIGEFVWNWTSRELTALNLTVNATINTTDLVNQVWSWSNRSLTFYADMTNYTKVNVGVWSYSNRTLFFLYGNGTGGSVNPPSGKLPLNTIEISTPDPFYFDTDYIIYYDPVDIKGATVDVEKFNARVLENITYTLTTATIMTDGRYKQVLNVPNQDITSFTLEVNATQNYFTPSQKAFINPTEKKAGITGFVTMDGTTKRNLLYLLFVFLFIVFLFIILAVVNKNKREKKSGGYVRY